MSRHLWHCNVPCTLRCPGKGCVCCHMLHAHVCAALAAWRDACIAMHSDRCSPPQQILRHMDAYHEAAADLRVHVCTARWSCALCRKQAHAAYVCHAQISAVMLLQYDFNTVQQSATRLLCKLGWALRAGVD